MKELLAGVHLSWAASLASSRDSCLIEVLRSCCNSRGATQGDGGAGETQHMSISIYLFVYLSV